VWVNDEEIAALAGAVGETIEHFMARYTRPAGRERSLRERANGDCVLFDRQLGCTVYEVRPRQCRTWPFWQSNVQSPEAWKRTCSVCPGSGQGELISADEITRRLKVMRI
jgi:Fe-S-cluster containining protein